MNRKLPPLAVLLLGICTLIGGTDAWALTMYKATVSSRRANLMYAQGGRMVPATTVNQGASLQVSDVTRNGWRQVLIKQGGSSKWGWVAESEVAVSGEIQVKNLPSRSKGGGYADAGQSDYSIGSFVFSPKGGYMVPFGAAGGPIYGADVGFQLVKASRLGKIFLSAQALWVSASAAPLGFSGNATYPSLQIGPVARGVGGSGFYAGVLGGVSLIAITVENVSASTLQFSASVLAGYDIQFSKAFSVGPEVSFSDVALGGYDTVQLLGALRIHL